MVMKRFMLASVIIFAVSAAAHSQDIKFVRGRISKVDWMKGKISVLVQDAFENDEIVIAVPKDAKIRAGADSITMSDLHVFDKVKIEYYEDPDMGGLKAIDIIVVES